MSTICEKCKKKVAHLIIELVEEDDSLDDELLFGGYEGEELPEPIMIQRTMRVCRPCAQEIQKAMLGGVTFVKPIGRK